MYCCIVEMHLAHTEASLLQIFVVRYDATKGQPNLRKHTDSSHLSFNILLNDEFEGGGTRCV